MQHAGAAPEACERAASAHSRCVILAVVRHVFLRVEICNSGTGERPWRAEKFRPEEIEVTQACSAPASCFAGSIRRHRPINSAVKSGTEPQFRCIFGDRPFFFTEACHANAPGRASGGDDCVGRCSCVERGREALVRVDLRRQRRRRAHLRIRELGAVPRDDGPDGRILSAQSRLSQRGGPAAPNKRAAATQAEAKSALRWIVMTFLRIVITLHAFAGA
jgi:hypothetical protein